jgi:hypothetical protein
MRELALRATESSAPIMFPNPHGLSLFMDGGAGAAELNLSKIS